MKISFFGICRSGGRCRRNSTGFSVIEIIFFVFILGLVLSLFSVSFLRLSPKYKLKKSVWEINSHLNYARYKAIFDGAKVRVVLAENCCIIQKFDDEQDEWRAEKMNFLEGVTVQANNSPIFHPQGTVSNLVSIIVSNSWGAYKITLAISGRIKAVKL